MSPAPAPVPRPPTRSWPARSRACARPHPPPDAGQATVEYALMLLGAAVIAIALLTWATSSGRIGDLFDAVFDELQSRM